MIQLAQSSGVVVHESGNKLYIHKRPGSWTSIFLFVTGLLAFILLANGVLQLTLLKGQVTANPTLGLALIFAALFAGFLFWKVRGYQKKMSAQPT